MSKGTLSRIVRRADGVSHDAEQKVRAALALKKRTGKSAWTPDRNERRKRLGVTQVQVIEAGLRALEAQEGEVRK